MKCCKKLTAGKGLVLALVLTLVFTLLSSAIVHDFGAIDIFDVELKTVNGNKVVTRVYKPDTATKDTPAPAVVFTHGLTVNKESYAQYGLELARRGFVVITPDMLNHGDSEVTDAGTYLAPYQVSEAYGAFAAVRYAATLDYVDKAQIGVSGHSAGGQASNNCVRLDDEQGLGIISAVYLVSSEPAYQDAEKKWANIYGKRDFGVYYTLYDHVYFSTYDATGAKVSAQKWLSSDNAKSLFAFGQDPSAFEGDAVIPGKTYVAEIDGETVIRRVNAAEEIHPMPQGGANALAAICDFFQDVFVAPHYIVGQDQHFFWLTVSNLLGMLFLLVSVVAALGCIAKLKPFKGIAAGNNVELRPAPNRSGRVWFWVLTILNCVFAFVSISVIFNLGYGYFCTTALAQQTTNIYALWSLFNGLFMLITSFGSYALYGRKNGATMENWGLKISFKNLLLSIAAAVAVCLGVFGITWVANNVFFVDYHYFFWGFKNIPFENLDVFFCYLPMYLVFGIAVSIAMNSAYHCKIGKEPEWVNDLFFAFMNMLPALAITLIGYYFFNQEGIKPFMFGSTYTYTYTINAIPVFPVAVVLIRRLFKKCNNPYIPGIIAGILLCWLVVSCSFTIHADMFYGSAAAYLP